MIHKINTYVKKAGYYSRKWGIKTMSILGGTKRLLKDRPGQCILVYHGVDTAGQTNINGRFISVDRFEAQIIFLKKHYNILPLSDLIAGKSDPKRMNIALTFDDGYRNNIQLALPVLEKHGVHATFFVTAINQTAYPMVWADYLDLASHISSHTIEVLGISYKKTGGVYKNAEGISLKHMCKINDWRFKAHIYNAFPDAMKVLKGEKWKIYWETLSDQELTILDASPNASVEMHTYYHENLGICDHKKAIELVANAKQYLENVLNREVHHFAYADGSYTRKLIGSLDDMGFKAQYAVDYLFEEDNKDKRIHNRLIINPFTSLHHQMWAMFHGRY